MKTFYNTEVTTAFRLPKELLDALNRASATLDMTRSQMIRRAVREFLTLYMPEGGIVIEPSEVARQQQQHKASK